MQRFARNQLELADLVVDAVYEGGRSGNAGDDPLPRLLGVSNQGGFRILGTKESPNLIVMTSSFSDPDWPDNLDEETGLLTYFGDNKKPGRLLHETPRYGNLLLQQMFDSIHSVSEQRYTVPPVLVFRNAGTFRDMIFLGVAVPGAAELNATEDLVAIWKIAGDQRFQNYRASFTILDIPCVTRSWLNEFRSGIQNGKNCPQVWRKWVTSGAYVPLKAERTIEYRRREDQLPDCSTGFRIIETIHQYFAARPTGFEACAAKITQMMDKNFISFNLTRPSRDGGRDAIGLYKVGHGASAILVDFALEAKCYGTGSSVGVREASRLISRLRHRQFGVLVTTSYLNTQAYQEIKEDGHPIVIVSARDILAILSQAGLNTPNDVQRWLKTEFPQA